MNWKRGHIPGEHQLDLGSGSGMSPAAGSASLFYQGSLWWSTARPSIWASLCILGPKSIRKQFVDNSHYSLTCYPTAPKVLRLCWLIHKQLTDAIIMRLRPGNTVTRLSKLLFDAETRWYTVLTGKISRKPLRSRTLSMNVARVKQHLWFTKTSISPL